MQAEIIPSQSYSDGTNAVIAVRIATAAAEDGTPLWEQIAVTIPLTALAGKTKGQKRLLVVAAVQAQRATPVLSPVDIDGTITV